MGTLICFPISKETYNGLQGLTISLHFKAYKKELKFCLNTYNVKLVAVASTDSKKFFYRKFS